MSASSASKRGPPLPGRSARRDLSTPFAGLGGGHGLSPGAATELSSEYLRALRLTLESNATASACARLLEASVLGTGGIKLKRQGQEVKLTEAFETHLRTQWAPFATEALRHLISWGFCPIAIAREAPRGFVPADATRTTPSATQTLKTAQTAVNPIPICPVLGQTVHVLQTLDERGLQATLGVYLLSATAAEPVPLPESYVYQMTAPIDGTAVSIMSTLFRRIEFVDTLVVHAAAAEAVRSRQSLVTTIRPPPRMGSGGDQHWDPAGFFQDRESRGLADENADGQDERQFAALVTASKLAESLNAERARAPAGAEGVGGIGAGASTEGASSLHVPHELPPRVFLAPANQDVVPNVRPPEARPDLVALMAKLDSLIASTFGIPVSMVAEGGKFSSTVDTQLHVFNSRVSSLNTHLCALLSATYRFITGDESAEIAISPTLLRSLKDLVGIHQGNVVSRETLVPLILQNLGLGQAEIDEELARPPPSDAPTTTTTTTEDAPGEPTRKRAKKNDNDDAVSSGTEEGGESDAGAGGS